MDILAITGPMGAGKSLVTQMVTDAFTERGECVHVVSLDAISRQVIDGDSALRERLAAYFGDSVLHADGTLDRAALAHIAFANDKATVKLNALTHPPTVSSARVALAKAKAEGALPLLETPFPLAFMAELFEDSTADAVIWTVGASPEIRIERAVEKGFERMDALLRMKRQPGESAYQAEAARVIENEGTVDELWETVRACLSTLG